MGASLEEGEQSLKDLNSRLEGGGFVCSLEEAKGWWSQGEPKAGLLSRHCEELSAAAVGWGRETCGCWG